MTYADFPDDIPDEVKGRRLEEIIALQQDLSLAHNQKDIGKTFEVLVEGASKRDANEYFGRNSQNKVIIFPKENAKIGDYVMVTVQSCSPATLKGVLAK